MCGQIPQSMDSLRGARRATRLLEGMRRGRLAHSDQCQKALKRLLLAWRALTLECPRNGGIALAARVVEHLHLACLRCVSNTLQVEQRRALLAPIPELIQDVQNCGQDPDVEAASWVFDGAPAHWHLSQRNR